MKMTKFSIRQFAILLAIFAFCTQSAFSQVTVGSTLPPNQNAVLDINQGIYHEGDYILSEKGMLLPRVNLASEVSPYPMQQHVAGMIVYNLARSADEVEAEDRVRPGFYFNTGSRWERLNIGTPNWFYKPSIVLDVSVAGPHTVDLHEEFARQFDGSHPYSQVIGSAGAPDRFKSIPTATDFYYYVIAFDEAVFYDISITEEGVLIYSVRVDNVTEATFMNIVFVER